MIEKKDGIQRKINFEGIRSFCVLENSSKGRKKEEQEKGKVEESTKVARRRSLGAVHTHTHTSNLEKEEKRVGENPTLKGMEKRRTGKRRKLFNCLSFLHALYRKETKKQRSITRKI